MLLNNFKPLLSFYHGSTFKDVLGNTVNKGDILSKHGATQGSNDHYITGSTLAYNYNATTASNSFTDEQTSYNWNSVVYNPDSLENWENGFTIFVGSGTTAATVTDFKLETPLTLDVLSAACYHNSNEKTVVQRTFKNVAGSSVTVNEIGCYLFRDNYQSTTPIILIGRTVLTTPVTISDGDMYTFQYEIDMSGITLG